MRIAQLIELLRDREEFAAVVTNARAQFGTLANPLLGPNYLPERTVRLNLFRERNIRFRSPIASHITRYSPPSKRGSVSVGDFIVETAHSGTKADITAEEMDVLMELLGQSLDFDAAQRIVNFVTTTLLLPVLHLNERERWQAIVDFKVKLRGENGLKEDVPYTNPSGNRIVLTDLWNTSQADAPSDLFALIDFLRGKGKIPYQIVSSTRMRNRFLSNDDTKSLIGGLIGLGAGGTIAVQQARLNVSRLNDYLATNDLPPWIVYDSTWQTETGVGGRFLRDTAVVVFCRTGEQTQVQTGDTAAEILPDTLGYYAIGRPAGRPAAQRHVLVRAFDDHPPRVDGEIVQEGLPVILDPDSIGVLSETAFG